MVILISCAVAFGVYRHKEGRYLATLTTIKPGFGTEELHVGMRCDELSGAWTEERNLNERDSHVLKSRMNFDLGVSIVCYKGRVLSLQYYLQETKQDEAHTFAAFLGKTEPDLRAYSSQQDVISSYGEEPLPYGVPPYKRRMLDYEDRGIGFIFNQRGLARILIHDRTVDPDEVHAEMRAGDLEHR